MTSHDAERAFVAAMIDLVDDRFREARAALEADLDAYGDDSANRYAEQLRAHQDRVRQLEEDQRAWLTRFLDGDADEPAPAQDVAAGQSDRSGPSPASGQGPRQPDLHAADAELADRLRRMDMATYTKERQHLVRANRGLFNQGETR